jgi:chorismate synthase
MNKFGIAFGFTTFGESHGKAIGCVVDGVPAGLTIDEDFIQYQLDRRKPGQNEFATARKEGDVVEILSGVFEGKSTGTPIAMVIFNTNQKSKDYTAIKDLFRPGHADFTYYEKYGIRDYRGGGRSSARETAARVAAGAIAQLMLKELGIEIESGIVAIDDIWAEKETFSNVAKSPIYALDNSIEPKQQEAILNAKNAHDSVGGVVKVVARNIPVGLGEPLYHKLDSQLASAMMGINAVKAVEIGEGINAPKLRGSQNNDNQNSTGFTSNHSGGILGGISNGEPIEMLVHFKPTPSIFIEQEMAKTDGSSVRTAIKGRHDPCVAIRGSVVTEAMMALVLADMVLLNMGKQMDRIRQYYT